MGNEHIIGRYISALAEAPVMAIDQYARFQHQHIIGQTGTGKSEYLKHGFLQDVHNGFGAMYFDFHGVDAPELLEYIPKDRISDVIYVDPMDTERSVGYNVFDGVLPQHYAAFTDAIVEALRHVVTAKYGATSWGAQMDDILINTVRPLFDAPPLHRATMLSVVRMLLDKSYRAWVLSHTNEQSVLDFWHHQYEGWSKSEQAHNLNSSLNKIRRFQSAPTLRNIVAQRRSTVDFDDVLVKEKIVILDLNKFKMGTVNASMLGALFIARLLYAATNRDISADYVPPYFVHIDEFHSVTTLSTIEVFTGARKFKLGFSVAHQYQAQLSPEMIDAIKGNVATTIAFRLGGDDARKIYEHMGVVEPKKLMDLPDHHFAIRLKRGDSSGTYYGYTELHEFPRYGYGQQIRAASRARYTRNIDAVNKRVGEWYATNYDELMPTPKKPSRKRTKRRSRAPRPTERPKTTEYGLVSMTELLKTQGRDV